MSGDGARGGAGAARDLRTESEGWAVTVKATFLTVLIFTSMAPPPTRDCEERTPSPSLCEGASRRLGVSGGWKQRASAAGLGGGGAEGTA